MKCFGVWFTFVVLATSGWAQTGSTPPTQEMIANLLRTGMYDGHLTKRLRTLGDESAVDIAKAISDRSLSSPEIDLILLMVSDAFSDPSFIQVESDRDPRVSLLLLHYLECSAQEASVKDRIAATRKTLLRLATPERPSR